MKLRTILAGTALAVALAASADGAQAQGGAPPVEGGTEVGGVVPSFLELILSQPAAGFNTFPKAKTYQMTFDALITTTDGGALLTLADGEAATGSKLGHLSSGAKRLPLPLEAKTGTTAFQPLDQSVDPLLKKWGEARTRDKATVTLRQKVKSKASGSFRKLILVTLSSETP